MLHQWWLPVGILLRHSFYFGIYSTCPQSQKVSISVSILWAGLATFQRESWDSDTAAILFFFFNCLMAALGLHRCAWTFSTAARGSCCSLWCEGFSLGWLLLWSVGSAAVAHGLGCSQACGIFPNEGLNLWPLRWQAIFIHCTSRKVQKRTFLNLVRGSLCILCVLSDPPGADLTKALFLREAHHRHDSQVEFLKQDLLSKERAQGTLLKSWTSARKRRKTVTGLLGSEASLACRVRRLEPVEGGQVVHRWPGTLNAFACEVVTTPSLQFYNFWHCNWFYLLGS